MEKVLKNIAELSSGYSFRGPVPINEDGSIFVVRASDIAKDGSIRLKNLEKVKEVDVPKSAILNNGDVLLVSRGIGTSGFRSAVFNMSSNRAIASAAMHVIRIIDKNISSEYLSAYLNSDRGQIDLLKITTGSSIKMLSLAELKELKISIPSQEDQKTFSNLIKNIHQQKNLLEKKQFLLDQVHKATTSQLIK